MLKDSKNNTILHLSVRMKLFNMFKILFDHIVKSTDILENDKKEIFNSINEDGNTILHEFALHKSLSLIDKLKQYVDEKVKNKEGYTYMEAFDSLLEIDKMQENIEKQKKEIYKKEKEIFLQQKK